MVHFLVERFAKRKGSERGREVVHRRVERIAEKEFFEVLRKRIDFLVEKKAKREGSDRGGKEAIYWLVK